MLGSPFGDLPGFIQAVASPLLSHSDKLVLARLGLHLLRGPAWNLLRGPDESTLEFLRGLGLSERLIDQFFRPFFGGIFLRRDLSTSARLFRYYLRMLLEGGAALPRGGLGAVAGQLAQGLDIRPGVQVTRLRATGEGVEVTAEGSEERVWQAQQVIVATDPRAADQLLGTQAAGAGVGATYLYYLGSGPAVDPERRLILSPDPHSGPVNNAHWLSNAVPGRVPAGQQLLVATVLEPEAHASDAELDQAARAQLAGWYSPQAAAQLRTLRIERIPYAQFAQPPGFAAHLAGHATPLPGVLLASEKTSMSSLQGALESGEKAAAALLGDTAALSRPRGG
ncbi:FAD-dependent oxidoreductase [Deinococcus lacus]|uniref:FAD-dependent oxidoreductase n=1 Tax=Deinococcus lacus TaxID=392561 RepID=A0ABW1YHK3_9DEIO